MQVTFNHLTGSKAGQKETVNADRVTVGRNPGSTVQFDAYQDLDVSGEHAQFTMGDDGKLLLTDLNSTNGTFMNGAPVKGPPVLCEPGSKVKFGKNGPECKIDYTPGPAKGGKTRMMLAQVQQDLEKQKVDAAETQKKTKLVAVIVVVVLALGGGVYFFLSSKSAKRDKAQTAIKAMLDIKQQADDQDAAKLVKDSYEQARAVEDNAKAALDAGNFEDAKKLAEDAQEQFKQAARLASVLKEAREKRDEAVDQLYAERYAPEELKRADELVGQSKKALKAGDHDKARAVAMQATEAYKDAIKKANIELIKAGIQKVKDDAEKKLAEERERARLESEALARKAEEAERALREEMDRLERERTAADAARQAELDRQLAELRKKPKDQARLIQDTINVAQKKVMLVETTLYVTADGAELELGQERYGTAFLYKNGHVVTAKQTLVPHLFEPQLKGLAELLKEQGREVKAKYKVWVYNTQTQKFTALFSTDKGNLDVGFMAPDVIKPYKVSTEVEFSAVKRKVDVEVHDESKNNIGSLVLKGQVPQGLEPADKPGEMQQMVVAVGSVLDKGEPATAPVKGEISRHEGDLVEIPTTYQAPRSVAGAPVLTLDAKVLGVIVYVGEAKVLYQPLSDVDKYIN